MGFRAGLERGGSKGNISFLLGFEPLAAQSYQLPRPGPTWDEFSKLRRKESFLFHRYVFPTLPFVKLSSSLHLNLILNVHFISITFIF